MKTKISEWFFITISIIIITLILIMAYIAFLVRCLFKLELPTWSRFDKFFTDHFDPDPRE